MEEVDRLMDDWIATLRAQAGLPAELDPEPSTVAPPPAVRSADVRGRYDAARFAVILAAPLNEAQASLTDDRMTRMVRYMEGVGLRGRIRGRDAVALASAWISDNGRLARH